METHLFVFPIKVALLCKHVLAFRFHSKGMPDEQSYLPLVQKWNEIFKVKIKTFLASNNPSELFMEDVEMF